MNGLFFAIGHEPATAFLEGQLALDKDGYIATTPGEATTSVEVGSRTHLPHMLITIPSNSRISRIYMTLIVILCTRCS